MNNVGKFVHIKCVRCKNTQIIFGKASMRIKCGKCNRLLIEPKGGKVRIRTTVKEVLR
jgi:small subunit ribosomal protein S27e